MSCKPKLQQNRMLSFASLLAGGAVSFVGINIYAGNESFYSNYLMPSLHQVLDAEKAHQLAIRMAKQRIVPRKSQLSADDSKLLETTVFGIRFKNPIGLAAGFDKNGDGLPGLSKMGFGFVEVGSVTPEPQPGNPKPRVFRLTDQKAIINRYGFNSDGHETVRQNLRNFHNMIKSSGFDAEIVIGVNLGKNKSSPEDSFDDYLHGLKAFADEEVVDYFVINISSPNTPGLRMLQKGDSVRNLLNALSTFRSQHQLTKPVLLKISPDLSADERSHVCQVVMSFNKKSPVVDGIIVSNTTTTRPESLTDADVNESGGLSGAPLRSLSTDAIRHVFKLTKGTIPIIGVGGIFTAEDAFEKVTAGASLVQIYTSLALEGPPVVFTIQRDLARLLRENGFRSVGEAVGGHHRK